MFLAKKFNLSNYTGLHKTETISKTLQQLNFKQKKEKLNSVKPIKPTKVNITQTKTKK